MAETNVNKLYIGSGAGFPIQLTENDDGTFGWRISEGDINLIKQNLVTYFNTPITSRFRDETFGTRLHSILEEPNTNVLRRLVKDWVISGINSWEPRLKSLEIKTIATEIGIKIIINGRIGNTPVNELTFYYNKQNNQFYANT